MPTGQAYDAKTGTAGTAAPVTGFEKMITETKQRFRALTRVQAHLKDGYQRLWAFLDGSARTLTGFTIRLRQNS
ncbi:MAG: hypothetical protein JWO19_4366 [Bryobacterales bacterium]|nr:hypothetical protein [Bryobacterales bacterium]